MEELEFKKTLAQALLSALTKGTICLENRTTNFIHLLFPYIKTVSHQTLERGDVTVTLLPIKQTQALPRDFQEAVSTLIQQEYSPVSNEILVDLQNALNLSKYPVLRISVSRSLLTLWLQHSSVTQWVLLKALGNTFNWTQKQQLLLNRCKISPPQQEQCLSTVSCSQSSTNSNAIYPAARTPYGSNNELKNVVVSLQIGACVQCLCRCYTCLPSDLTVYRTCVVAQHAATLVRLAGGRVQCCCCTDGDPVPAIVAECDDSEWTGQKVSNLLDQDENFKNICDINCSGCRAKVTAENAMVVHLNTEFKEYLLTKTPLRNTAALPTPPGCFSISALDTPSVPDVCATINATSTTVPVAVNAVTGPCLRRLTVSCASGGRVPGMMEVGPVLADHNRKKVKDLDVTQCWRLVLLELQRACAHKQTDVDSSWCAELPGLACSCLRLLVLTPTAKTPLLLRTQGQDNVRDAAFQLYNYARVCALLRSFDRLQQLGSVPPLPSPQQVHYQALREPEEWELVWVYIYKWPGLVAGLADEIVRITECCADGSSHICSDKLTESKPSISARPFNSHAVCRFLHGLCHCFSVYYNRVHVLPTVRNTSALHEQLLQTLFARIYLLTAVKNTMSAAFFVLGVLPPTEM